MWALAELAKPRAPGGLSGKRVALRPWRRLGSANGHTGQHDDAIRGAGANFAIGNGLGVLVIVEKKTPGPLRLPGNEPHQADLLIRSVKLEFSAAPRDEENTLA